MWHADLAPESAPRCAPECVPHCAQPVAHALVPKRATGWVPKFGWCVTKRAAVRTACMHMEEAVRTLLVRARSRLIRAVDLSAHLACLRSPCIVFLLSCRTLGCYRTNCSALGNGMETTSAHLARLRNPCICTSFSSPAEHQAFIQQVAKLWVIALRRRVHELIQHTGAHLARLRDPCSCTCF